MDVDSKGSDIEVDNLVEFDDNDLNDELELNQVNERDDAWLDALFDSTRRWS